MEQQTYSDPDRVYEIPLKDIFADNEFNCRGSIDYTDVIELANDIRKNGLDSPVVIRPLHDPSKPDKKWQLVAGFRRFAAHRINKAETIRALVKLKLNDIDARIHNLRENLQRQDLNIKQEAKAIEHLKFIGLQNVADRIGKSYGWVQNRMYLLQLPEEIQEEAAAGLLNVAQIRECANLPSTDLMFDYVKKVKEKILMGKKRDVDADALAPKKSEKRTRNRLEIGDMQDLIRDTLGNNLATRALGWAGGYLNDCDLYESIKEEADAIGKEFEIPESLGCAVKA